MPKYRVWDLDRQDERDAIEVTHNSPKLAAQRACELMNDRAVEYPPERRLRVRGRLGTDDYTVELRSEPVYIAKRA